TRIRRSGRAADARGGSRGAATGRAGAVCASPLASWLVPIEAVERPVVDADDRALALATLRRRPATDRLETLDGGGPAQDARALGRLGAEEEPGHGGRVGPRILGLQLADDLASVTRFPGRTGIVPANGRACEVEELRFGPFQGPLEAASVLLGPALV